MREVPAGGVGHGTGRWWRVLTPRRSDVALRLFCFPHAGAGPSAYAAWARCFPESVEVVGVHLPGRETRISEPSLTALGDMVAAVVPQLKPLFDRPFAFFGHSMGALMAFEVARALQAAGGPLPTHLFVSGRRAPDAAVPDEPLYHRLATADLVERVRAMGGVPEEILEDEELVSLLVPIFRADFMATQTYTYRHRPPLRCPITTLAGDADALTSPALLDGWARQTCGPFRAHVFPGGHFFLLNLAQRVCGVVAAELGLARQRELAPQ
jgi:medium-chain acyl-[acyl-carrier-protein] hydrolase